MIITINGKEAALAGNPDRTLDSLLEEPDVQQRQYVTVELNGEILDRTAYEFIPVNEGDVVESLYVMGV
jgi:sulfur carrier protein